MRSSPGASPMPPNRAFVVQFRESTEPAVGWFSGRIEHMMSGQSADFVTPEGLIEFFGRVMNREVPPQRKPPARVPWSQVLVFTLLAYSLSWLWWAPLVLPKLRTVSLSGRLPDLTQNHSLNQLALGMFGPLLTAAIMRVAVSREGIRGTLGLLRPWRYYLIALAAPAILIAAVIGVDQLAGLGRFVWKKPVPIWTAYPSVVLLNSVIGAPLALGEEYGWRGYLLPRLLPLGEVKATLLLGMIWGLWHLPALVIGLNYPSQPLWAVLLVFALNILLLAFPFTWLYIASRGSPFVVAVMHATLNAAGDGFTTPTHIPQGNPLVVGGGGLMTSALVLIIVGVRYTVFRRRAVGVTAAKSLTLELQGNRLDWLP